MKTVPQCEIRQVLALPILFFFLLFEMCTGSKGEGTPHPSPGKPVELVSRNFLEL